MGDEYELNIDDEGGIAEVESTAESSVKLKVFRECDEIRISMDAMATRGHFAVGAGLSPEQAKEIAHQLISLAVQLDEEEHNE
jgi:hypothetical protein